MSEYRYEQDLATIRKSVDELTKQQAEILEQRLTADDFDKLKDRLSRMITYAVARYDWYEDRRWRFLQFCTIQITIVGIGTSFLCSSSGQALSIGVFLSLVDALSMLASGSVLMMLEFRQGIQAPRPHRPFLKIRSWYFKYHLDEKVTLRSLFSIGRNPQKNSIDEVNGSAEQFKLFVKSWTEISENKNGYVMEDIQQVFALMTLQKHSHDSGQSMRLIWEMGLGAFTGVMFVTLISTFFL